MSRVDCANCGGTGNEKCRACGGPHRFHHETDNAWRRAYAEWRESLP